MLDMCSHAHRLVQKAFRSQGGFRIQRDSDSAGCPNVVCSHCQAAFRPPATSRFFNVCSAEALCMFLVVVEALT